MKYDIKPHWNINAEKKDQNGIQTENLEETLRSMPQPTVTVTPDQFDLTANLPISLEAKVLRNLKPGQEIVRLSSGDKHVDLVRGADIGVSCDPNPLYDEVPVRTINIDFRDVHDDLTDRGVVWVHPGNPARMSLVIKAKARETPGTVTEIITAAEEAVKKKVLAHFI